MLVREGKGGKTARCGIDKLALAEIRAWEERRAAAGFTAAHPLFPVIQGPTRGGELRTAYMRALFSRLGKTAGITKRIHPHSFRHALAVEMVRRNIPMPLIQRQLRHSSLATTANYLASIAPFELYAAMADLEWSL